MNPSKFIGIPKRINFKIIVNDKIEFELMGESDFIFSHAQEIIEDFEMKTNGADRLVIEWEFLR